ncbi:hypothetical protein EXIGLDRAFT_121325 [Exidia glandulosa HHB12029]|uniref:Uncharacterized protein n=1 Tax=Exidia glandulosa HHB12029 TaxID=1314781 RepID=A0A165GFK4_EXIGL|nr:hypothetical protein EXIGLDRAFT_775886 [Exidia glandulosa HHB12029]KZV90445.1 hypothetical protein EXIGLDRAFT_121325 [Exidia glandulosa HHB12029]
MASSPLQAFDPLAKHYFTSHGTPMPPPTASTRSPYGASYAPAQASSLPSQHTPRPPVKAPQPLQPAAAASAAVKPIFTSFQKDRASPDLPDVKKKPAATWGASSATSPAKKQ